MDQWIQNKVNQFRNQVVTPVNNVFDSVRNLIPSATYSYDFRPLATPAPRNPIDLDSGPTPEQVQMYQARDAYARQPKPYATQVPTPMPTQMPIPTQAPARPVQATTGYGRNPNFNKKTLTPEVEQAILTAAREFGLPPSLLFDIAWHEGGLYPKAKNESPEGRAVGVPVGLFQFTPGTWNNDLRNYVSDPNSSLKNFLINGQMPDREDPVANSRAAAYLIKQGQLAKWDASLPGWGQYYSDDEIADYYWQSPGHSKRRKK